ncbi:hypothetical protein DFAR_30007 [Desulfarculales bacterium]
MNRPEAPNFTSPAWLARRQALAGRLVVARGEAPVGLMLAGGRVSNLFTGGVEDLDMAVHQGLVVGLGSLPEA